MTLSERLALFELVVSALRNNLDLAEITQHLPAEYQLEAFRFMEFLGHDSSNDGRPQSH